MKEHEKLIAFLVLIISVCGLAFLASTFDRGLASDVVVQGKLRIIDSTVAGLLTIAGMAAQALFKIGDKIDLPRFTGAVADTPQKTPLANGELPESERIA